MSRKLVVLVCLSVVVAVAVFGCGYLLGSERVADQRDACREAYRQLERTQSLELDAPGGALVSVQIDGLGECFD